MLRSTGRKRVLGVLVPALAVAVVVIVVVLGNTSPATPDGATAQPALQVCPDIPPSRKATLRLPASPRVLIFGDSYTEGYGADPETEGFAYKVGAMLHWRVSVDGVGGTGFVNTGPKNEGNYLARIGSAPDRAFDLIVIEGGSNDSRLPLEQLQPAIDATLRAVQAKYPGAQVALMGPIDPHGSTTTDSRSAVNAVLTRYAASTRLVFFSPICEKWFTAATTATLVNRANGHPNNAGYAHMAHLFVRDVKRSMAAA